MKRKACFAVWVILGLVLVTSCSSVATPIPATNSPLPTFTPTPQPLGHPENPLVIGFVVEEPQSPENQSAAQRLSTALTERAKLSVQIRLFETYTDLIASLEDGAVHAVFLPPITYIYAHDKGVAEVELLANHFGVYFYGSMFLANAESKFTRYFDPVINRSTAPAETALPQLAGTRPCWVDPTSIAGYLVPAALLKQFDIETLPAVIAQTHSAIVRALYIKGICDFGATFAISGDPRTASTVLNDLPDAEQRVVILWQTEPIIPNLNVSFHPRVPAAVRQAVASALMDAINDPELNALISQLNQGYTLQALKRVDDSVYDPLREVLSALSPDLETLLGR